VRPKGPQGAARGAYREKEEGGKMK
jgi:hypothetical protein